MPLKLKECSKSITLWDMKEWELGKIVKWEGSTCYLNQLLLRISGNEWINLTCGIALKPDRNNWSNKEIYVDILERGTLLEVC